MAITTDDGLKAAIAASRRLQFQKASQTTVAGFYYTTWRSAGMPTGNVTLPTTTGQTLSRTSTGALPLIAPSGITYAVGFSCTGQQPGTVLLADRLLEYGGLSFNVTTAQTVSALALPTRATTQVDVELWLEVMTVGGGTASASVTASYTNQAGTSGRTATLIGGLPTTGTPVNRCYPFSLQAGDTGVQSVQSVTLGTATGTAGSLGLVLKRTLLMDQVPGVGLAFSQGWAETHLQDIPDDAALEIMHIATTTTQGTLQGALTVAQG